MRFIELERERPLPRLMDFDLMKLDWWIWLNRFWLACANREPTNPKLIDLFDDIHGLRTYLLSRQIYQPLASSMPIILQLSLFRWPDLPFILEFWLISDELKSWELINVVTVSRMNDVSPVSAALIHNLLPCLLPLAWYVCGVSNPALHWKLT